MSDWLAVIGAVIAAFALVFAIVRISMWRTGRKTSVDFKKERPDRSDVNGGGYMF